MHPFLQVLPGVLTAISPNEGNLLAYAFGGMVAVYLITSTLLLYIYYKKNKRMTAEQQPSSVSAPAEA
ncbi:MAG TPA: hypothetical protein VEJ36_07005 [Nitrososphaerales archaeon]|nr:hypothetical protein [Nitrososphaerales archaeon]